MKLDLRVYALIDPEHLAGHDIAALTAAVAKGGATLVQLRDKSGSTRQMLARALALREALSGTGVPLLINDRVDVALASGAQGVHVGQDDIPVAEARRLLGCDAIIGLSLKSVKQAEAAPLDLLSYVAIGGVFTTVSKNNPDRPVGPDGLRAIAAVIRRRAPGYPVCAIAGIDESNAVQVIEAGADGAAVISALSKTPDPAAATARLRRAIDAALAKRGVA